MRSHEHELHRRSSPSSSSPSSSSSAAVAVRDRRRGAATSARRRRRCPARRASATAASPAQRPRRPPVTGRGGRAGGRRTSADRRGLEPVGDQPARALDVPPDPETLGVTRRQFLNRASSASWASASSRLRRRRHRLPVAEARRRVRLEDHGRQGRRHQRPDHAANDNFLYLAEGRTWLTEYPAEALPKAEKVYPPPILDGMEAGIVALYQKCPHLGCRVPSAPPRSGSSAPATARSTTGSARRRAARRPAAWTASPSSVDGGNVVTSTPARIIQGPPIGTNTTGQEAEGPHCISEAGRTDAAARRRRPRRRSRVIDRWSSLIVALARVPHLATCATARPELGAEIELAPNRKPYYDDEAARGPAARAFQLIGLGLLAVIAVGLPLYWLAEPGRQAGAVEHG